MRLRVSPAAASTPTCVFNQRFEVLFPQAGALGCVVCHLVHQLLPLRPAATLPRVLSTPPTGLDECFFFISLVVRLPYSSVFCQFWLFFVFKLFLSFFWLCEEAQCVYLRLQLGWKSFCIIFKSIFRDRNIDLLFHLLMRSSVDSCMCPDWGSNPQPWCIWMML